MWETKKSNLIRAFKENNEVLLPTPYGEALIVKEKKGFYHEDGEDYYWIGRDYDALIKYIKESLLWIKH